MGHVVDVERGVELLERQLARSTYPFASTVSRIVAPSASACLAIFAAASYPT